MTLKTKQSNLFAILQSNGRTHVLNTVWHSGWHCSHGQEIQPCIPLSRGKFASLSPWLLVKCYHHCTSADLGEYSFPRVRVSWKIPSFLQAVRKINFLNCSFAPWCHLPCVDLARIGQGTMVGGGSGRYNHAGSRWCDSIPLISVGNEAKRCMGCACAEQHPVTTAGRRAENCNNLYHRVPR